VTNLLWMPGGNEEILSRCTCIQNLWINGPKENLRYLLPFIAGLPLKCFYCAGSNLFGSPLQTVFSNRILSQITHLRVFDIYYSRIELDT
jgi:hypothetical protein